MTDKTKAQEEKDFIYTPERDDQYGRHVYPVDRSRLKYELYQIWDIVTSLRDLI